METVFVGSTGYASQNGNAQAQSPRITDQLGAIMKELEQARENLTGHHQMICGSLPMSAPVALTTAPKDGPPNLQDMVHRLSMLASDVSSASQQVLVRL